MIRGPTGLLAATGECEEQDNNNNRSNVISNGEIRSCTQISPDLDRSPQYYSVQRIPARSHDAGRFRPLEAARRDHAGKRRYAGILRSHSLYIARWKTYRVSSGMRVDPWFRVGGDISVEDGASSRYVYPPAPSGRGGAPKEQETVVSRSGRNNPALLSLISNSPLPVSVPPCQGAAASVLTGLDWS